MSARTELRGHRQSAASKDQRALSALAIFAQSRARARGAREFGPRRRRFIFGFCCARRRRWPRRSQVRGQLRQHGDRNRRHAAFILMARISRARVRGRSRATRSASRPTRSSRLGGASPISFSRVLFRQFFLEIFPATLVSRATRNRTDPLAPPAGRRRRFLFSGWGRNDGARAPAAQLRGRLRYHPDRNSTELGGACSRSRNGRL